jgi:hypothetical protein
VGRQLGGVVSRKDRDELRLEDSVRVAGHRGQETLIRDASGYAGWDRSAPGAQLDECALEGVEEEIEIQKPSNLVSREDEHG